MTKAWVTMEGMATLLEPNLDLPTRAREPIQKIIRSELDPVNIWHKILINAPEFLDTLQNAPMILAHTLQQMERERLAPRADPYPGLKGTVLAGFFVVAIALLALAGIPWPIWGLLMILALGFALRSLG